MFEFIKGTADKHKRLSHQLNKGENHRISKTGVGGSLWITPRPRFGAYDLETTGEAAKQLNPELTRRFGKNTSEKIAKGYKIWRVENQKDVEAVIAYWATAE